LISAASIVNEWETQSQADPTGFHVNVKEVNGTAQTANDNGADVNSILVDTTAIKADVAEIGTAGAGLTDLGGMSSGMQAEIQGEANDAMIALNLDHLVKYAVDTNFATTVHLDSVIGQMVDDGSSATFDRTTDSNEAIRIRGDSAWITGGGGSIADILNVQPLVPNAIDLADTATVRISLGLTNMVDDLPSTAEIAPGTISIDRKAIGGTTWTNIVNAAACSELAGLIYYDEVFDSGTGYAAGDTIRITFKSQKITVSANDFEITGADGWIFHTFIREAMRGTDSAALAATALTDVTWTDAKAAFLNHSIATIDTNVDTLLSRITAAVALASICTEARLAELDAANLITDVANIKTETALIVADTNELQTDWVNGGRLDLILDACALEATVAALNNISSVNVTTACTSSLNTYDSPTRAEATTDKNSIITEVNANETKIDTMQGNVTDILTDTGTTIPGTISTLQTDSTAIKAKTDNLPSGIAKNEALPKFDIYIVLSSDHVTAATGKTIVGQISKDGGAFAGITNPITEVSDGMYTIDSGFTQTEMNADVITLKFTETDCDQRIITIYTT